MKEFLQYFFGAGSEQEFALFTLAHFAPILAMILVVFFLQKIRMPFVNPGMR